MSYLLFNLSWENDQSNSISQTLPESECVYPEATPPPELPYPSVMTKMQQKEIDDENKAESWRVHCRARKWTEPS